MDREDDADEKVSVQEKQRVVEPTRVALGSIGVLVDLTVLGFVSLLFELVRRSSENVKKKEG